MDACAYGVRGQLPREPRWRNAWSVACTLLFLLLLSVQPFSAEVIPPAPQRHFNDYAGVVSVPTAQRLDRELDELEKTDSTQVLVAIFKKMESDSSLDDYAVRVYQAWGVGTKNKSNGAILFIFVQDRKVRIQTGYGLEGPLPDAICKRIIDSEITPNFRAGNFDAGVSAGVAAMVKAVHGEYKGTGRTVAQGRSARGNNVMFTLVFVFVLFVIFASIINSVRRGRSGTVYRRSGRRPWGGWGGGVV